MNSGRKNKFKLKRLHLSGFKSFDSEGAVVDLCDVNVCIGANGAGKSNLVSFFRMLNHMINGRLQQFIGEQGFADAILYRGAAHTPAMTADLHFEGEHGVSGQYVFSLSHGSAGGLIVTRETLSLQLPDHTSSPMHLDRTSGGAESLLVNVPDDENVIHLFFLDWISGCQAFQFHNTSSTAGIRNPGYINDNQELKANGANLAAFLYAMSQNPDTNPWYQRIVRYIQAAIPQFDNFLLEPSAANESYIRLDWYEKGSSYRFGPHQFSDGALRLISIFSLLLQPPHKLPGLIVLDEPELGMHPAALGILAEIIRSISHHSQIFMATQSTQLVDLFQPEDILVIERNTAAGGTQVKRLDSTSIAQWLDNYSLADLWEKNIFGGRP